MRVAHVFAVTATLVLCAPAHAWNGTGHQTVAALAYRELKENNPATLKKIHEVLKQHPHYDMYLSARRPANVSEEEWVFLHAASWADWVKSGPQSVTKYNIPDRHFVDLPLVRPGDEQKINKDALQAFKDKEENILVGFDKILDVLGKAETNPQDRAVALCWLFHLMGDSVQPLHCRTFFSAQFPKGDGGGNAFYVHRHGKLIKLHSYWDDLLGPTEANFEPSYPVVDLVTEEIRHAPRFQRTRLAVSLGKATPKAWVDETAAYAEEIAYQKGALEGANLANHPHDHGQVRVPDLPDGYEAVAKELAKKQVAIAGFRLSDKLTKLYGQ